MAGAGLGNICYCHRGKKEKKGKERERGGGINKAEKQVGNKDKYLFQITY